MDFLSVLLASFLPQPIFPKNSSSLVNSLQNHFFLAQFFPRKFFPMQFFPEVWEEWLRQEFSDVHISHSVSFIP
jgi:hypothetical protein